MGLVPVYLGCHDLTVGQPDCRQTFELAPAPGTMRRNQARQLSETSPAGDQLDSLDRAEDLELEDRHD